MKITYTETKTIESRWDSKENGIVLVKNAADIPAVYEALVEQDSYWGQDDNQNPLIQVMPENMNYKKLKSMLRYNFKQDIDDVNGFIKSLAEKGIEVFVYSEPDEDTYL